MPLAGLPDLLPLAQAQQGGAREFIDNLARTPLSEVVVFVAILTVIRAALFPYLTRTLPHLRSGAYPFARFLNEAADAFVYAGVVVFMIIRPFVVQAFLIPSGSMVSTLLVNDFIVANKAVYRFSDPKAGDIVVFRPPKTAILDPRQIAADGQVKIDFIKRCIGTPGDLIELRDNVLYRNGQPVEEPYKHFTETTDQIRFSELPPDEVKRRTPVSFKLVKLDGRVIPLQYTAYDANSPVPRRNFEEPPPYATAEEFLIPDPAEMDRAKQLPAQKVPEGYYLMMGDNRNGSFDSRGWGLVPREAIIGRSEFIWLPMSRWQKTR